MTTPSHISEDAKRAQARKKRSVMVLSVVLALLVVGVCCGVGYMVWQQSELERAAREAQGTPVPENPVPTGAEEDELPSNPIDFAALKSENPDIYAWIYIPNTNINLPIVQHVSDDNYYLRRNVAGEDANEGSIFTQSMNATDFSDPVTVVYGHNTTADSMFTQLHYFENEEFFAENDVMYIYTPGHILTYRIISAYQYDDRHIMNSFDFSDADVLQRYFDYVANPDSLVMNVREGTELDAASDRIVQLSTCLDALTLSNRRYLVSGVLIDDQETR